jgi:hypothetical protein
MAFALRERARLPLAPAPRGEVTTLQASLHAADRPVARPLHGTLPSASHPGSHRRTEGALPQTLASLRTGLAPAGRPELDARLPLTPVPRAGGPSCWTHSRSFCHRSGGRTFATIRRSGRGGRSQAPRTLHAGAAAAGPRFGRRRPELTAGGALPTRRLRTPVTATSSGRWPNGRSLTRDSRPSHGLLPTSTPQRVLAC